VKYQFVADHAALWPVTWMCQVLGVTRSKTLQVAIILDWKPSS
jgi:hypothetical protein